MRTTLTLDDDVLLAAKERARRENRSLGAVISDLARQGLTSPAPGQPRPDDESFHGFRPFSHRGATVSNALIDQLLEDGPE
jgi:hypothetical protein